MYSNDGPPLASGDLNGDNLDDLVIGGASGQPLRVLYQQANGTMQPVRYKVFEMDKRSEDTAIVLADLDGDGDLDIYAGSGGNEFSYADPALKDRIYTNTGADFVKNNDLFPAVVIPAEPTAFVHAADIDDDGDIDIIAGARLVAFNYGRAANAYLLRNRENQVFENATSELAPDFDELGILTDAVCIDLNNDGNEELVMVGEWMAPVAFIWENEKLTRYDLNLPKGLYKSVGAADVNSDGKNDLILGNHGLNSRLHASADGPLELRVNDYDDNGRLDHILSINEGGEQYPLNLLQDLSKQMPVIRKKYATFADYGSATTDEVLNGLNTKGETRLQAENLATFVALNSGNNSWEVIELPFEAQMSPMYEIFINDFNNDGQTDLLLGGNQKKAKPELGIYNASYGVMMLGNGDGTFNPLRPMESGIEIRGEIRSILPLKLADEEIIVIGRNNTSVLCYRK
jgi:hypothetical protein